jgi:hypothetical protein
MNVSSEWFPMRDPRAGGTIYIWVLGGNKMAHHLAREFKHDNVLRMLNERTPKELELVFACELGDEARLRELLQQQPDLLSKLTNADHQRLIAAAESSNARTVRLMLEAGWPVNVHHADGVTALHWAAFHGNVEMVRDLVRFQAPLEVEDATHHGKPLGWAVYGSLNSWRRKDGDYPAVVTALLGAGAQITNEGHGSEAVEAILRARR